MNASSEAAPTRRQLSYLRILADRTGTTFASPATRAKASREIERLRGLEHEPNACCAEGGGLAEEHIVYATAVHDSEVSGFGASATWRAGTRPSSRVALPTVPERGRTELARYTVRDGERVLYGERLDGRLSVTDRPGRDPGRSYLVEGDLEPDGYGALDALVMDYIAQARDLDEIPMASEAVCQLLASAGADA
jgi:hypothetical protein